VCGIGGNEDADLLYVGENNANDGQRLGLKIANLLATPVMLPPGRAGAGPGAALYNVISGTGANTVDGTTAERAPGSPRVNDSAIAASDFNRIAISIGARRAGHLNG
jgi:hypothetical protein